MSIARRFALPFMAASAVVVLSAAAALAQVGPNNPSGGTSLNQTRSEGPIVSSPGWTSSATTVWKGWYGNFAVSRYGVAFAGRSWDLRSPSAFLRRPTVLR
jgi:uncharacterized RDD family membrane protein YckC